MQRSGSNRSKRTRSAVGPPHESSSFSRLRGRLHLVDAGNMQHSLDAMKVALRILTALNEKHTPDPADVEALRSLAGPQPQSTGLDELACEVIQIALARRAGQRAARF